MISKKAIQLFFNKGKSRKIYLPETLCCEVLEFYKDKPNAVYVCESFYGRQMSTRGIAQALKNFSEKYKIDKKVMHPHSFRHMFAINFLKNNKNFDLSLKHSHFSACANSYSSQHTS